MFYHHSFPAFAQSHFFKNLNLTPPKFKKLQKLLDKKPKVT